MNILEIKTPHELFEYAAERELLTDALNMIILNDIGYMFAETDGKLIEYKGKMYFTTDKEAWIPKRDDFPLGDTNEELMGKEDLNFVMVWQGNTKGMLISKAPIQMMVFENYMKIAGICTIDGFLKALEGETNGTH